MQVQKIQNNNYSPNFRAKLGIRGSLGNVSKDTLEALKIKASKVGRDTDTVIIRLLEPRDYALNISFNNNVALSNNYSFTPRATMQKNPSYISRSIIGYVEDETKARTPLSILSYKEQKGNTTHENMTISRINDFLDTLIINIRK